MALTLAALWMLGHLFYAEGVVYLTFHRDAEDSVGPVTSGYGLRLSVFVLVVLGLTSGCCTLVMFFSNLWRMIDSVE